MIKEKRESQAPKGAISPYFPPPYTYPCLEDPEQDERT